MAGTGAIWRDNNVEGSSTDKIEFDTGATPDALSKLSGTTITLLAGLAFLKKPKAQMNRIQDTFFKGMHFQVLGYVQDPTSSGALEKSKIWAVEPKSSSSFDFGRFGLRLDDFPGFNIRPNANRGIFMGDFQWEFLASEKYKARFSVDCYFQANATGLGSTPYNWNTT